jgi:hypothetical protein
MLARSDTLSRAEIPQFASLQIDISKSLPEIQIEPPNDLCFRRNLPLLEFHFLFKTPSRLRSGMPQSLLKSSQIIL